MQKTALKEAVAIRPLEPAHLPQVVALTQAIGWPHRLEDMQFALSQGRGFAVLEEGSLTGAAMWWPYGEYHAMIGSVIVSPERQGRGIGRSLIQAIIAGSGGRSLLLNATKAGLPLYRSLGFEPFDEIDQYQAIVSSSDSKTYGDIRPAAEIDLQAILALDRRAAGMPRVSLTEALIADGETVVLDKGGIIGFSIMRKFGRGSLIGPVIAPDAETARTLIAYWLDRSDGSFVRVDLTGQHGLAAWLIERGLRPAGPGITMVHGEAPSKDPNTTLFAISSQAMG